MESAATQNQHKPPCPVATVASQGRRKLRESCIYCAKSKVKCSKDKPICTRCNRRGLTCEYTMSRRLGRTRAIRAEQQGTTETIGRAAPETQRKASPVPNDNSTRSSIETTDPQLSSNHEMPGLSEHSQQAIAPRLPAIATGLTSQSLQPYCSADDLNLWDVITSPVLSSFFSVDTEFGHFFASQSPQQPDDPDGIICGTGVQEPARVLAEYPSSTELQSPSAAADACLGDLHTRVAQPCCLFMCLDTFKGLFSSARSVCERSGNHDPHSLDTIETVMRNNRQILDTVHSALECRCADDEYVATLVSLIVFKVLEWYTVVAQIPTPDKMSEDAFDWTNEANTRHHSPQFSLCASEDQVVYLPPDGKSYFVHRTHQNRMTAQVVLGELYRVQQLVTLVVRRLDAIESRSSGDTSSSVLDSPEPRGGQPTASSTSSLPPARFTLIHLATGLRTRLREVSAEIISALRRA